MFFRDKNKDFFDFCVSLVLLATLIFLFFKIGYSIKFLNLLCILKSFRFLGLFSHNRAYLVLFKVIKNLLPFLFELLVVVYLIFYSFTALGVYIWGGLITYNTPLESVEYYPANYQFLNFNDFASGYLTLFSVLIINNWIVIVTCLTNFVGVSTVYRYYFASFILLAGFLSSYILIGLMIEVAVTNLSAELKKSHMHFDRDSKGQRNHGNFDLKQERKQTIESKFEKALKIMHMNASHRANNE